MKLITSITPRRDGTLPAVEIGKDFYSPDESGVYDVPEHVADHLLTTGHFTNAEATESSRDAGNVLTRGDGKIVDLDGMNKTDLVAFGKESFGLEFKKNDSKPVIIAAIMAAVKADEMPAE